MKGCMNVWKDLKQGLISIVIWYDRMNALAWMDKCVQTMKTTFFIKIKSYLLFTDSCSFLMDGNENWTLHCLIVQNVFVHWNVTGSYDNGWLWRKCGVKCPCSSEKKSDHDFSLKVGFKRTLKQNQPWRTPLWAWSVWCLFFRFFSGGKYIYHPHNGVLSLGPSF